MSEQFERFQGRTMGEVLENIRRKFGHEAMIMGSRKFRTGGFLGFGGREMVEVYVADTTVQVESLKSGSGAFSTSVRSPEPAREVDETLISRPPIREQGQLEKLQADLGRVHSKLNEVLIEHSCCNGFSPTR